MTFAYPLVLTFSQFYSFFHYIKHQLIKLHFLGTLAFDLFVFLKGVILFNVLLTKIDKKRLKKLWELLKNYKCCFTLKIVSQFETKKDRKRMSKTSSSISGVVANIYIELLLESSQKIVLLIKRRSSFLIN